MKLEEYAGYDAVALSELVDKGEVTPTELLELALSATESVNSEINAVVSQFVDKARSEIDKGLPKGPFTGVPFLIKECMLMMEGAPYRLGSKFLEGCVGPHDTELMSRYKRAGLVTFGTTSTPEGACSATTEPTVFGPTRNPWNLEHSSGGSSGGAGAAVAAGIVPIAHGNDGGGSIRIPAACNGVVGLKPTRHRVPQGPDYGELLQGLSCELALTRTIRDTAAVLDAVQGADPGAKNIIAPPERPYTEEIRQPHRKMKIALMETSFSNTSVDPEIVECVRRVGKTCEDLGHEVSLAGPKIDWDLFFHATSVYWTVGVAGMVEGMSEFSRRSPSEDMFEALTWACYMQGRKMSALELIRAQNEANTVCRNVGRFFNDYDLLLTPTIARLPVSLGELNQNLSGITPQEWFEATFDWANFTPLFNMTGQPAISLPLGISRSGLPIGIQFAGQMNDEAALLRIGAELESTMCWSKRIPPIHVSRSR